MNLDFQRIKYFIIVAESLNFSQAAHKIFVSPQALNKQIIKLEEEVGHALFVRNTRKVRLTEEGKILYEQFQPIVRRFEESCKNYEEIQRRKEKVIRIGYFQSISRERIIQPIVYSLMAMEPDNQIQIKAGEVDEVIEWLREGSVDLCITNVHEYECWNQEYVSVELFQTPAVIVTSLYHPWVAKQEKITKEDMEKVPILLLERQRKSEDVSFYKQVPSTEKIYTPNFNSMLVTLETSPYYAVFPKLFESMETEKLKYFSLPDGFRFLFQMMMIYNPQNRFAGLFHEIAEGKDDLNLHL